MQDSYQPEGESESDESIESEEDNEIGDDESDNVEDDVHVLDEKPTDSPKEVCEEFLFIKIWQGGIKKLNMCLVKGLVTPWKNGFTQAAQTYQ